MGVDHDEERDKFFKLSDQTKKRSGFDADLPEPPPALTRPGQQQPPPGEGEPDDPPVVADPPYDEEETGESGDWYYEDFVYRYPPGSRPMGKFGIAVNILQVKHSFWDRYQNELLPIVQQWLDDGWQPVSEIGPSALVIDDQQQSKVGQQIWAKMQRKVFLEGIKVKMRKH